MPSQERKIRLEHDASIGASNAGFTTSTDCAVSNYGQSDIAVIVTHPWGPLGGNMHNNVVVATILYFQRLGWTTCRFDFAPHDWVWATGATHVNQVQQVAHMLLHGTAGLLRNESTSDSSQPTNIRPPKRLLLVGYSYGSLIAGAASATIPECIANVFIAPPFAVQMWLLSFRSGSFLERAAQRDDVHRLFLLGDQDNFTSEATFRSTLEANFPETEDGLPGTEAAILRGADHFFRRREKDLMAVVAQWLKRIFPECHDDLRRLAAKTTAVEAEQVAETAG